MLLFTLRVSSCVAGRGSQAGDTLGPLNDDPRVVAHNLQMYDPVLQAGVGKLGTDEDVFTRILVSRSVPHLFALFQAYQNKYGQQMEAVIEDEMSGDTKRVFLAIGQSLSAPCSLA